LAFTGSYIIKPNDDFKETFLPLTYPAIGTGPFKLTEISPTFEGQQYGSVLFERYEEYYKRPANITDMVYTVLRDGEFASTAMLKHELHYGGLLNEHIEQAETDPDITIERVKTMVVYYLDLSIKNIPYEVRRAMSFGFDYTYYLQQTLKNESYELHTPIPAGMQYHNPDIEGLPYYNKTIARQYMLNCTNITDFQGLTINSSDEDWIAVAVSDTPIFDTNFTRYTSTIMEKVLVHLVDNFAYIGIKVTDAHYGTWCGWEQDKIEPQFLQISMRGWGPNYNDAINMIEPIYNSTAPYNEGSLANATLDAMFSENYEKIKEERVDSFDNIVFKLMVENCPSMYLSQLGRREVYNNKCVSNIEDLLNGFDHAYWYNVIYTPQKDLKILALTLGYILLVCTGVVVLFFIRYRKRRKFLTITQR